MARQRADESSGRHLLSFTRLIGGRRIAPGRYRASITATSPGAPPALPRLARFVILRG